MREENEIDNLTDAPADEIAPVSPRYVRRYITTEAAEDIEPLGKPSLFQRVMLVVITLLLIFAILATSILPGFLAAERNEYLRRLPPPTILPRT